MNKIKVVNEKIEANVDGIEINPRGLTAVFG